MTPEERALLLTTANVLRDTLRNLQNPTDRDLANIAALNGALAPFESTYDEGGKV